MAPDGVPEEWQEYFDNLQVMVFSGSRHFSNPRTLDEFAHIANQCIQESHQRLYDSDDLVAHVCDTLSRTALMPWGTRLAVQGRMKSPTCTDNEPGKVSEHLCLLRGPHSQGVEMGNYWIGIVRHDETSYMTGDISWLVKHIAGRGKRRKLLFARDVIKHRSPDAEVDCAEMGTIDNDGPDATHVGSEVEVVWDNSKIDKFNELIGAA